MKKTGKAKRSLCHFLPKMLRSFFSSLLEQWLTPDQNKSTHCNINGQEHVVIKDILLLVYYKFIHHSNMQRENK